MGALTPFSTTIPRPVGQEALGMCSAAGVNLMSKQSVKLKSMAEMLQSNVNLLSDANATDKLATNAVLGASLIKATCEAFVDMAGALGGAAHDLLKDTPLAAAAKPLKSVQTAASWIGTGTKAADYGIGKAYGQKTDGFGVIKSAADSALGMAKGSTMKDLAELQSVKVEIVKNAMAGDPGGVKKEVFLSFAPKIASMTLEAVKKEAASKLISAGAAIAKSGATYSEALEKAFDEKLASDDGMRSRKQQIGRMRTELATVIGQIKLIDSILADCQSGKALASTLR